MATVLLGNEWIGVVEPTTGVLPGQSWVQVDPVSGSGSGVVSRRDSTNTYWITSGNINANLGGAVSVAGDSMTGPLQGAPNIPPIDSPDFLGTVLQDGLPMALQIDLSNLQKLLYDQIAVQVRQQFLSQFQQSSTAADIAFYRTTIQATPAMLSTGVPIPLPVFQSDGVTATPAQVLAYGWATNAAQLGGSGHWEVTETSPGSRVLTGTTPGGSGLFSGFEFYLNIWAFAVR